VGGEDKEVESIAEDSRFNKLKLREKKRASQWELTVYELAVRAFKAPVEGGVQHCQKKRMKEKKGWDPMGRPLEPKNQPPVRKHQETEKTRWKRNQEKESRIPTPGKHI